jgi:biofilm PGA synthesis N-glycosyltransferase PgaC
MSNFIAFASFFVFWYPTFYWYFNALVILRAIPKALFKNKKKFATWDSPDRGISV